MHAAQDGSKLLALLFETKVFFGNCFGARIWTKELEIGVFGAEKMFDLSQFRSEHWCKL
jgi:hypothetical protein